MTHKERAIRRQRMAMNVKNGDSIASVAKAFDVGSRTIQNACIENGVISYRKIGKFVILKEIMVSGLRLNMIGRKLGVSAQRISKIYSEAINIGIPGLPEFKRGRVKQL